jgi:transcriptional regulator with XRE-family HTH domain
MTKGRGSGNTPQRVVEAISAAVKAKSQSAVARESGLTLLTVQRYLKGIGEPTNATLQKLADYFKTSVAYLRGEIELTGDAQKELETICTRMFEEYKNQIKLNSDGGYNVTLHLENGEVTNIKINGKSINDMEVKKSSVVIKKND